jgi:hypothetical protein
VSLAGSRQYQNSARLYLQSQPAGHSEGAERPPNLKKARSGAGLKITKMH